MNTMLLDVEVWDLCITASGDWAMATGPYALAQDAASAILLFQGEYWYQVTLGNPYFADVLSYEPPVSLLKGLFQNAALSVPGVVSATCYLTSIATNGVCSGQVQISDSNGSTAIAGF